MSEILEHIGSRLVQPRPDCLIWPDAVDRGYGRISIDGQTYRVHRVVWELTNGPIPEGLTIDHLCRVRYCCNPEHMELVTREENLRRAVPFRPRAAGRLVVGGKCRNGHLIESEADLSTRKDGGKNCLTCLRAGYRRKDQRKRERRLAT